MTRSEIIFGLLRIPCDFLAASSALFLAYFLRLHNIDLLPGVQFLTKGSELPIFAYFLQHIILPWSLVFVLVGAFLGLYNLRITVGVWREVGRVFHAVLLWLSILVGWYLLIEKQLFFSRALLIHATIFLACMTVVIHFCILFLQRLLLLRGIGVRCVMSCGHLPLLPSVEAAIQDDPRYHYIGHISPDLTLLLEHLPDLLLHTDPNPQSDITMRLIDACRSHHIGYAFLPPVFADVPHLLTTSSIGLVPLLRFQPTPLDGWGRVLKRFLDILGSLLLLIILSPLFLIVSIILLLTSGWPIFYVSTRVGQYGTSTIPVLKFRTMCRDADAQKKDLLHLSHRKDGPLFKMRDDPRITHCGRFLRRTSIDELPQLINALLGHMSLVGPRPHLPEEVQQYKEHQRRVFAVRPGITGLSQISGRSNLSFDHEVHCDMRYIEEWSIGFDLWILWRTIFVVLFGKGAD